MAIAKFTVMGRPKGKARPRSNFKTGAVYTPTPTTEYEKAVNAEYQRKYHDKVFVGEVEMCVEAYFPISLATGAKKAERMVAREIRPQVTPDGDNILKIVADALNGFAYEDDKQIVTWICKKYYSDDPRIDVFLRGDLVERGVRNV